MVILLLSCSVVVQPLIRLPLVLHTWVPLVSLNISRDDHTVDDINVKRLGEVRTAVFDRRNTARQAHQPTLQADYPRVSRTDAASVHHSTDSRAVAVLVR